MGLYRNAAITVLKDAGKPLHYKEITSQAIKRKMITPEGKTPADTMNAQITMSINHMGTASEFVRVEKGVYGLNPEYIKLWNEAAKTQNAAKPGSMYIGGGGEHLVLGKLLLHGYNANLIGVDDGIDIVAIKDNKMYGIQVKARNKTPYGYVADICISAYERNESGNTFYVFVLLGEPEQYVILPFHAVEMLIDDGCIKTINKGDRYRATFVEKDGKVFLGERDLKLHVGNWDSIK